MLRGYEKMFSRMERKPLGQKSFHKVVNIFLQQLFCICFFGLHIKLLSISCVYRLNLMNKMNKMLLPLYYVTFFI